MSIFSVIFPSKRTSATADSYATATHLAIDPLATRHWWNRFLKVAIASVLVLIVMTGAILYYTLTSHIEFFSTQLDRNAEVVKERINSILTHADESISHAKKSYELHGIGLLQDDLKQGLLISEISSLDYLGTAIWSKDAHVIETTNPAMSMYSAKSIVAEHLHSNSDDSHISCKSPIQFFLSKRINDEQGDFHGVIATELSSHRFDAVTKNLSLSSDNRFTVSHANHPHVLPGAAQPEEFYREPFATFLFKNVLGIAPIVEIEKKLPFGFSLKSEGNVHQYLSLKLQEETGLFIIFLVSVIFLIWISARIADKENELRGRQIAAQQDSITDELTGFMNRRGLVQKFADYEEQMRAEPYSLICIDVDRFKLINDTMGHMVGDEMLRVVAQNIRNNIGTRDTAVRLGGDEFAIVVAQTEDPDHAATLAERIVESFNMPIVVYQHRIRTTVSIGIACYPAHGDSLAAVLNAADNALYAAKANGRDQSKVFESTMQLQADEELVISQALHNSLKNNELSVFFQPILNTSTNQVVSLEALLRWHHPAWGVVAPDKFIPVAENFRLIIPIGEFVFEQACRCLSSLPEHVGVSVNVSAVQLMEKSIVENFLATATRLSVDPKRIVLEITETVILRDEKIVLSQIEKFRDHGFTIALDDFGTGFSTLSHLTQFPLDRIKIDRAFINNVEHNNGHRILVKKLIELAHELGMQVTAEGVETVEQARLLTELNCHDYQGYYFCRPAPLSEINIAEIERHAGKLSNLAA